MRRPFRSTHPRWRSLLQMLAVLALILAACNGEADTIDDPAVEPVEDDPVEDDPVEDDPVQDDPVEEDPLAALAGTTADMIVPYGPGGAYDRNARAIQPFFQEHTDATVVVHNEPGAGSLLATNRTFTTPPTEQRLQLINTIGVVSATLGGAEGVNFDLLDFSWVGGVSSEPEVVLVNPDGQIVSLDDLLARSGTGETVRFGSTGPGDNFWLNALILGELFDLDVQVVSGFESAPELYAAAVRGDIDVAVGSLTSALPPVAAGDLIAISYFGDPPVGFAEVDEALDGVPALPEVAADAGAPQEVIDDYMDPYLAVLAISRTVVAPPGVDADLLEAYRRGLEAALTDPAFQDAAAEQGLFPVFTPGEEVETLMAQILDAPERFVQLVEESFAG